MNGILSVFDTCLILSIVWFGEHLFRPRRPILTLACISDCMKNKLVSLCAASAYYWLTYECSLSIAVSTGNLWGLVCRLSALQLQTNRACWHLKSSLRMHYKTTGLLQNHNRQQPQSHTDQEGGETGVESSDTNAVMLQIWESPINVLQNW